MYWRKHLILSVLNRLRLISHFYKILLFSSTERCVRFPATRTKLVHCWSCTFTRSLSRVHCYKEDRNIKHTKYMYINFMNDWELFSQSDFFWRISRKNAFSVSVSCKCNNYTYANLLFSSCMMYICPFAKELKLKSSWLVVCLAGIQRGGEGRI